MLNHEKKNQVVVFVDIGHSKSTITAAKFTYGSDSVKSTAEVLYHDSDKTLGGREIDWILMEKYSDEFE